ncbi:MAG: FtsH protease activity modulator HflK [Rhodospirillales bacterium]|nr:FtsH protease activity modulator HflK [Rhodospirillales bacterium]MCB9979666.1 FtsH protease activity modulator HflK [Rhodospirillales bacterium]
MGWDDQSDTDKKKRQNPWGSSGKQNNEPIRGPWGSQGSGGGRRGSGGGSQGEPPDLDEVIRKARENFGQIVPEGFGGGRVILIALVILVIGWLATGVFIVQPGEQGVIQRFGQWSRTQTQSGLGYHLPVPIETVTIVNVQELRRLSIGYSEAPVQFRGRESTGVKRDVPEESLMLTSDRNIVDIDLVVLWNIRSAEDFLFNIEYQEATIKKVAESAIREVVGQNDMFPIITRARDEIAARAKEILQKNLDDYNSGVNVSQVLIEKAEVHPEVQNAFQDVQSAKQDAEDTQNQARAYREDILPKARGQAIQMVQQAEGYKQSAIARAKGDADRFNSVLGAYRTGEDVTKKRIYLETMEQVFLNANKIILDQKQGGQGVVPYLPLNELNKKPQ